MPSASWIPAPAEVASATHCAPAGTAVRFEPGERKRVRLVALAGERIVYGGNGLIDGQLDDAGKKQQALEKLESRTL